MIGNASKLLCHPDRLTDFRAGRAVIPITVELHISDRCIQKCSYCRIGHNGQVMSRAMIRSILVECEELGICGILLSGGGEPLLGHINEFQDTTIPCGLITNGVIPASLRHFSWVRFSVDSRDPATYRAIRGADMPTCLEDNIHSASYAGVQMVICNENISQCRDMAEWSKGLGAKYLHIRPDDFADNPPWPTEQQLADAQIGGIDIIARRDKLGDEVGDECSAGHFMMTIAVDGKCYVCACGKLRYEIGDLTNDTLEDVIWGQKRARILEAINPANCNARCKGRNINVALSTCGHHGDFL